MRIELFGTKGLMFMERHGGGWQAFDGDDQPIMRVNDHQPHLQHMDNFFKCVESRKRPNADIEDGHLSTVLCQMGNISYHLDGRKLHFDGATERFEEAEANAFLKRPTYREPWLIPEQVPETGRWADQHKAEKQSVLKMEFKGFLNAFMRVPCQIVRQARRVVYRLLAWNPWQHVFLRGVDALRCPLQC